MQGRRCRHAGRGSIHVVTDEVCWSAGTIERHDRAAQRHRLAEHRGEALPTRRQDEQVCGGKRRGRIGRHAGQRHPRGESQRLASLDEHRTFHSLPMDRDRPPGTARRDPGEGFQQTVEALLVDQPAHRDDPTPLTLHGRGDRRVRAVRPDHRIRQDHHPPPQVAAEIVCCRLGEHHDPPRPPVHQPSGDRSGATRSFLVRVIVFRDHDRRGDPQGRHECEDVGPVHERHDDLGSTTLDRPAQSTDTMDVVPDRIDDVAPLVEQVQPHQLDPLVDRPVGRRLGGIRRSGSGRSRRPPPTNSRGPPSRAPRRRSPRDDVTSVSRRERRSREESPRSRGAALVTRSCGHQPPARRTRRPSDGSLRRTR